MVFIHIPAAALFAFVETFSRWWTYSYPLGAVAGLPSITVRWGYFLRGSSWFSPQAGACPVVAPATGGGLPVPPRKPIILCRRLCRSSSFTHYHSSSRVACSPVSRRSLRRFYPAQRATRTSTSLAALHVWVSASGHLHCLRRPSHFIVSITPTLAQLGVCPASSTPRNLPMRYQFTPNPHFSTAGGTSQLPLSNSPNAPNNALQRTASHLGVEVFGSATAAGAAPVTPPATTGAPAGGAPRTALACSCSVPAGAGSQRRSLSLAA